MGGHKSNEGVSHATTSQDGRVVYGAAFRSQSSSEGVGSNPTSDKTCLFLPLPASNTYIYGKSVSGIMVSIAAFQAVDPGSIPWDAGWNFVPPSHMD